jgi:hypothetical protein
MSTLLNEMTPEQIEENARWLKADREFYKAFKKYLAAYRKEGASFYIVLDDGETFSPLHQCSIVRCPDKWDTEAIETALAGGDGWDDSDGEDDDEDDSDSEDDGEDHQHNDNIVALAILRDN